MKWYELAGIGVGAYLLLGSAKKKVKKNPTKNKNPEIGKREDSKRMKKIGGRAFPKDYNWICNICGGDNRAYETTCQYCDHEAFMQGRNPINWTHRDAVLSVMPTMYPLQVHNIARRTGMSRDEARKVLGGLVRSGHVISTNEGYKKIKNPGAAWHEEQAKHADRLVSVSKDHSPYFMGARDADRHAAGVSRQKGMPNPRRRHRK